MGSTVLCGKAAAAFVRPDTGETIYVLSENTYEKNCYPHNPHWSVISIGNYRQVMKRVFMHAGVCEGGMLQSRSGWIKPENYIKDWQEHLSSPTNLVRETAKVSIRNLSDDKKASVIDLFVQRGRTAEAELLQQAKTVTLNLIDDADLALSLLDEDGPLPLYRAISHATGTTVLKHLGFNKSKEDTSLPKHRIWRVTGKTENVVISKNGGPARNAGWVYSAVSAFIQDDVYPLEMACTGISKKLIPEFREACQQAPLLPQDSVININTDLGEKESYLHSYIKDVAKKLGIDQIPKVFSLQLENAINADAMWPLMQLKSCSTWEVGAGA